MKIQLVCHNNFLDHEGKYVNLSFSAGGFSKSDQNFQFFPCNAQLKKGLKTQEQPISSTTFWIKHLTMLKTKLLSLFLVFKESLRCPPNQKLFKLKSGNLPRVALLDRTGRRFSFLWVYRQIKNRFLTNQSMLCV